MTGSQTTMEDEVGLMTTVGRHGQEIVEEMDGMRIGPRLPMWMSSLGMVSHSNIDIKKALEEIAALFLKNMAASFLMLMKGGLWILLCRPRLRGLVDSRMS